MIISLFSCLGFIFFLKFTNDFLVYQTLKSIENDPKSYRNTYQTARVISPLSDKNND
jgi:hypothetical protein